MQVRIVAKNLVLSADDQAHIEHKVTKLTRISDRIQEIDVVVERLPRGSHVELVSDVERHRDFIANASADELRDCIDQAMDKSVRQLNDWKELTHNHKHHPERRPGKDAASQ